VPDSAGAALEPAPGAREDAADPSRIVEQFVVASWDQHLRQHQRVTVRDQQRLDKIRAMTDPGYPPRVTYWLTPEMRSSSDDPAAAQPSPQPNPNP